MQYRINSPVEHGLCEGDSRRYEPGELIDLDEAHAEPLLACGAIEHEHKPFEIKINSVFVKA